MEVHDETGPIRVAIDSQMTDLVTLCELLELVVNEFQPSTCAAGAPVESLHFLSGELGSRVDQLADEVSVLSSKVWALEHGETEGGAEQ